VGLKRSHRAKELYMTFALPSQYQARNGSDFEDQCQGIIKARRIGKMKLKFSNHDGGNENKENKGRA
jgi:hypothetical protein